jgi:hypothetical protein
MSFPDTADASTESAFASAAEPAIVSGRGLGIKGDLLSEDAGLEVLIIREPLSCELEVSFLKLRSRSPNFLRLLFLGCPEGESNTLNSVTFVSHLVPKS